MLTVVILVVFLAGGGFYMMNMMKRQQGMAAAAPGIAAEFLERTGFRIATIPPSAPIDAHVQAYVAPNARQVGQELVRTVSGVPLRHYMRDTYENGKHISICDWSVPAARPVNYGLQIAEWKYSPNALLDAAAADGEVYCWTQRFQNRFEVGDKQLDDRFAFMSDNPQAAINVLRAPGIKELLLQCQYVEVVIDRNGVKLSDPKLINMYSAMGIKGGLIATTTDPKTLTMSTIPLHDQVSNMLLALGRVA